jgi:transposase
VCFVLYIVKPPAELTEDVLAALPKPRLIALVLDQATILRDHSEMLALLLEQNNDLKAEIRRLSQPPPPGGTSEPPPTDGKSTTPPPEWAKANTPAKESRPRRKRANAFVRHRAKATREIPLACDNCPDCARRLTDGTESSRRQIIDMPEIKVEITDYITMSRYCGVCRKSYRPSVDLKGIALGKSCFSLRVHAFVAYLRQECRLPIRQISALLTGICHVKVSIGEIVRMLHTVASFGKDTYDELGAEARKSAHIHGDETGWRENGQNGYMWSFSNPTICYFLYPKTRAGHVVTDVLGDDYKGVLVSDFYAGYNTHFGLHQRCWVHLLRAVHELYRKFPMPGVLAWAKRLRDIYDRAKAFSDPSSRKRARARVGFQKELNALVTPFARTLLPQSTLCKRLIQYESEMFTFVEYPFVPSENNPAERSIRPRVIARKISGGTRAENGSDTMVILSSLFATWKLRGLDTLQTCCHLLATAKPQLKPKVKPQLTPAPT